MGESPEHTTDYEASLSDLSTAIFEGMKPRKGLPRFSDEALSKIRIPAQFILGEDDVTMDSLLIKRRVQDLLPQAEVETLRGKRHFLGNQVQLIEAFLNEFAQET